ncbi:LacI family DNA-binding transcriptional regulator [Neobacillus niacini]|uniref:LacI family DNA-binding transcriptional regulator n=1 Tax=Neobacillus niacini TaxID=86668 RepID=UPI00398353F5
MTTMKEVAKEAGVSIITVSRVLNSPELVKPVTRKKVEEVMGKLNFQTNQAAKALVNNQTRVIHLFIPQNISMNNPFAMHFISGISDVLSSRYYSFLVRREWDFPYKCDGIIGMGISTNEEELIKEKFNVPFVLFGHTQLDEFEWVEVDNFQGAYDMTDYLISLGHKEIGFILINENRRFAFDRLNGYKKALVDHGIPVNPDLIQYAANEENDGYIKSLELLSRKNISALFCTSDELALGAIRAARILGKKIPQDISIAGFDGLGYENLTDPKITTMHQPVYEAAKTLANVLVDRIENPHTNRVTKMISPIIRVNQSVSMNQLA